MMFETKMRDMCDAVRKETEIKIRKETEIKTAMKTRREMIKQMLKKGTIEQVAEFASIPIEEVEKIAKENLS